SMNCSIAMMPSFPSRSRRPSQRFPQICSASRLCSPDPQFGRILTSGLRSSGLQRQRVQFAAHFTLERLVDELVLLNPRFALERGGDHGRRIVVPVAGEVADRNVRVWDTGPDQPLDLASVHSHRARLLSLRPPPYSLAASSHAARATPLAESAALREAGLH